jgi:ElaB/YqjD/DUF883 family membrane-anchored ribosome-binding protein
MTTETSSSDDGSSPTDQTAQSLHADAISRGERGAHAVRSRIRQARDSAQRASRDTANYVKNEPIKAILIALAVGALLSAVVGRMFRSRDGA